MLTGGMQSALWGEDERYGTRRASKMSALQGRLFDELEGADDDGEDTAC